MTPDQHIEAIRASLLELEAEQDATRKAVKRARKATALLHARLTDALIAYSDTHGLDSPVVAAAVAPKERPE